MGRRANDHNAAVEAAVKAALSLTIEREVCPRCFLLSLVGSAAISARLSGMLDEAEFAEFLTSICVDAEEIKRRVEAGEENPVLEGRDFDPRH